MADWSVITCTSSLAAQLSFCSGAAGRVWLHLGPAELMALASVHPQAPAKEVLLSPPSPRIDVLCNSEAITACLSSSGQLVSGHDDSAFLSH